MTSADLTEMEWLAATLRATADRLQRATALLRAAGDLERLQAKLNAIAAERPSTRPAERPGSLPAPVGRSAEVVQRRESVSVSEPIRGSRAVAVFGLDCEKTVTVGKITAGGTRPPF